MSGAAKRVAMTVVALGAVAALLVVTRPGPRSRDLALPDRDPASVAPRGLSGASHRGSHGGPPRPDASAPASAASPDRPDASGARSSHPFVSASSSAASAASASAEDAGSNDAGQDYQSWREHGRTAVVRLGDSARKALVPVDRPLASPDWSAPLTQRFTDLKGHYRTFRKTGDFPPETVKLLHGAAVTIAGAVMPVDPIADSGAMKRLWLANPVLVMAGCVFCNPPTMGDLVFVDATAKPIEVDPEKLFRGVVIVTLLGRLRLGPGRTPDGIEYLYRMDLERALD